MSDKKYDPKNDDPLYFRYQELVEKWSAEMCSRLRIFGPSAENFQLVSAYFARKLYKLGYEDAERLFKEVLEGGKKVIN
jgi:hypothetical protein